MIIIFFIFNRAINNKLNPVYFSLLLGLIAFITAPSTAPLTAPLTAVRTNPRIKERYYNKKKLNTFNLLIMKESKLKSNPQV